MDSPDHSDSRSADQRVISVSALNRTVAQLLGRSLPMVWVAGEVSNFTQAASGHCYLTLKDRQAQVRAVVFRSRARALAFEIRNGLQVQALARVSLYEPRGEFQLTIEDMRLAGAGDLHQQFVALKNKLQAEGLFDVDDKRMLPALPRQIGLVTSLQAAAMHDVLATLKRRAPHLPIVVYPTPVQGEDAPVSIVRAIETAGRRDEADVLLLVRGGGSIEDLWAFNDERVARAIRACPIPVVVGVGHESDITIADFAADLRAPTPTGAATAAAPEQALLARRIDQLGAALARAWRDRSRVLEQRLDTAWRLIPSPAGQYRAQVSRLDHARSRLIRAFSSSRSSRAARLQSASGALRVPDLRLPAARLAHLTQQLNQRSAQQLKSQAAALAALESQLALVSPQAVLERGYSIVRNKKGEVISQAGATQAGQPLDVLMSDGELDVLVQAVKSAKSQR